jgi:hypothetical protein
VSFFVTEQLYLVKHAGKVRTAKLFAQIGKKKLGPSFIEKPGKATHSFYFVG